MLAPVPLELPTWTSRLMWHLGGWLNRIKNAMIASPFFSSFFPKTDIYLLLPPLSLHLENTVHKTHLHPTFFSLHSPCISKILTSFSRKPTFFYFPKNSIDKHNRVKTKNKGIMEWVPPLPYFFFLAFFSLFLFVGWNLL